MRRTLERKKRLVPAALALAVLIAPLLVDLLDVPEALGATLLQHRGLVAPIALLAGEESGIPLPVPGDVIIAYTGYEASKGTFPFPLVFVALLVAVLMGSSVLYAVSRRWGQAFVLGIGR